MRVRVFIKNKIYFKYSGLGKECMYAFKNEFTYTNQTYITNERLGYSVLGVPRFIKSYAVSKEKGIIAFNRGTLKRVINILESYGHVVKIIDKTIFESGKSITYTPNVTLRKDQSDAVECAVKSDFGGIIKAFTSFGKTLCGLSIISRLGKQANIIVWSQKHQQQWYDEILKFNFLPENMIGGVGGIFSKPKVSSINLIMQQSIATIIGRDGKKLDLFKDIPVNIVDECLHGDTLIATEYGHKKIKDICIGDKVKTPSGSLSTVVDTFTTNKDAYKYTFENTSLIASKEHVIPSMICKWEKFHLHASIKELIHIDKAKTALPFIDISKVKKESGLMYLVGLVMADGTIDGKRIKFGFRRSSKIKVTQYILKKLKFKHTVRVNSRGDTIITIDKIHVPSILSKFLYDRHNKTPSIRLLKKEFLTCNTEVIRGIFDGDGTFTNGTIQFELTAIHLIKQIHKILNSIGVPSRYMIINRRDARHNDKARLTIAGMGVIAFMHKVGSLHKDIYEKIKVHFSEHPIRKKWGYERLISKEYVGKHTLYDITLDNKEKLFVANGIQVHNCQRYSADTFDAVLNKLNGKYRVGVSADIRRSDKKEFMVHDSFGDYIYIAHEKNTGSKILATINLIPTEYENINYAYDRNRAKLLSDMTHDKDRNTIIVKRAMRKARKKKLVLIMVERKDHAAILAYRLRKFRTYLLLGPTSKKTIENYDIADRHKDMLRGYKPTETYNKVVELSKTKDIDIIIGTSVTFVGLSIKTVDHAIICTPSSRDLKLFNQKVGRVERSYGEDKNLLEMFGKKPTPTVDYLADMQIPSFRFVAFDIKKNYPRKVRFIKVK